MNLQCDLYHPFQALADLMTMQEKLDSLKRVKVSIIWAYAENHKKPISVPVSQLLAFRALWHGRVAGASQRLGTAGLGY